MTFVLSNGFVYRNLQPLVCHHSVEKNTSVGAKLAFIICKIGTLCVFLVFIESCMQWKHSLFGKSKDRNEREDRMKDKNIYEHLKMNEMSALFVINAQYGFHSI